MTKQRRTEIVAKAHAKWIAKRRREKLRTQFRRMFGALPLEEYSVALPGWHTGTWTKAGLA